MFLQKLVPAVVLLSLVLVAGCGSDGNIRQTSTATPTASPAATPAATAANASTTKLNINTATGADFLRTIPNLGNRMVHEFEEYRPYKSIQQFRKEIGKYVDQNQVAEYEKYIFVPINEGQSDAATLQQIPGLDANETQELIAGRPYASREAFVAKLGEKVSAGELAVAKTYLAP
jgi:DNA uptake protein ComE-like DNA-binding protein